MGSPGRPEFARESVLASKSATWSRSSLVVAVCLLAGLLQPAIAQTAEAPSIETIDGVRHVRNGAVPLQGERLVHLEQSWRVDTETEDELIGSISAALAGPDQTVWLADRQLGQVLVYSRSGRHLRTLSRQGEGPGEINAPSQLLWLAHDGLGIVDQRPGQITQIDTEGLPRSSVRLVSQAGEPMSSTFLTRARRGGEILVIAGLRFETDAGVPGQVRFLSVFDLSGQERLRLRDAPSGFDFQARTFDERQNWFPDRDLFDVDPSGRIYLAAERDRYRIDVRGPDGSLVQVIERQYAQRRRTSERKEELVGNVSMNINNENVQLSATFDDFEPAVESLHVAADSRLWVMSGHGRRPERDGVARSYDVFDTMGRFVEILHLAVTVDVDRDWLLPLGDGRWILLKNLFTSRDDEDDSADLSEDRPLEIICLHDPAG